MSIFRSNLLQQCVKTAKGFYKIAKQFVSTAKQFFTIAKLIFKNLKNYDKYTYQPDFDIIYIDYQLYSYFTMKNTVIPAQAGIY